MGNQWKYYSAEGIPGADPSFLKKIIYFNWRIIIYNIVMVFAIHRHESAMGTHVYPHPEACSHLPPHPTPLGYTGALVLSALLHEWNLELVIYFTYGNIYVSMLFS